MIKRYAMEKRRRATAADIVVLQEIGPIFNTQPKSGL
jgi:hypothetical protein